MASFLENAYSLVHLDNTADQPTVQELKLQLEKGNDETKVETMKRIITIMLNGDPMSQLLMHIIRFVMPSKSKPLKKLLYFYYEICPKHDANGKLKQEMILVCNGIRNDLQHPNEYIRGNTLRFLCKLREPELIEPLLSSARSCLEHRHAYVRKNAVWAVASIFQHSESLIPDAPELIQTFLESETDSTCKRNAFAALMSISHQKALEYLGTTFDSIPNTDELLQLAELEFIRKDAVQNTQNKGKYLRLIFDLLEASTSTVVYEAATSLTALTSNPVAVKAAAGKLIELCIKEADNNVKLIVLDRVDQLRSRNEGVLDDLTMEILRVLSSPDIDVRRKALGIALEMVSSKNVEEVVMLLKKELGKTVDEQYEKNSEYRQLLIQSIHHCAIKFSEIAASVVDLLMDFIADFNNNSAVDVISFVKEVVEKFPKLRASIVDRLVSTLSEVRAGKVYRGVLWVVGEYSLEEKDIREAWKRIRSSLGEIPILASEQRLLDEVPDETALKEQVNGHTKPSAPTGSRKVLADGTYATESALTSESAAAARLEAVKAAQKPPLRQLILDGDYYLATVLSSTLTKLVMRHSEVSQDVARTNALRAEAMLIMISIIRVGQSQFVKAPIDEDSIDRIMCCVRSLSEFSQRKELETTFLEDTRKAFRDMVQVEDKKRAAKEAVEKAKTAVQVDDAIPIRQFTKKSGLEGAEEMELDLAKATGGDSTVETVASKLSRVVQLTGFSDPVYAEAYVTVHQFDIVLDVLLVNQTLETLQNLSVEFATLGDLKVVERPTTHNLGPRDFLNVQATVKVSSTDTGVIFGNIVYDGASSTETHVVILNDIHADIMDYIQPAHCTETQFRTMWTEFEWENKVNINSKAKSLREFLKQLMESTNMACLTPEASIKGDCRFLSANLYARSVFGEDALANLSIEKEGEDGPITGFVVMASSDGATRPSFNADQPDSQSQLLQPESTLTVGQSVTLTLGSDALVIVGEQCLTIHACVSWLHIAHTNQLLVLTDDRSTQKPDRGCCGLLSNSKTKETQSIALYNILHAEVSSAGLTITYADPVTKHDVTVGALQYTIADEDKAKAETFAARLLDLAYGNAKRYRRFKVLINPFGGKGIASRLYHQYAAPILAAAHCVVEVEETTHGGHATEIAEQIDIDAYDAIVCCSGDGLPYEVFNGLAKKPNAREALSKLAVAMIPGGSGNAMAWNLCGTGSVSVAALAIVKGVRTPIDLVSVTQGKTRTLSFLSQSFGIVAESDLGTDNIRWMGAHRFTYGFLVRLMQRTVWPCDLAIKAEIDDKKAIKEHYRKYAAGEPPRRPSEDTVAGSGGLPDLKYGTVLDELPQDWEVVPGESMGNFYAGNMAIMSADTNFFPASLPNDGLIDVVTIDGTISRLTSLKMMTEIPEGGFFDMPDVRIRKASAYRLTPREKEGYISVDGERIPFEPFQVEVHRGLGTVLSKSGHLYEAEGPRP
ncbi:hypothetical protein LV164_001078 [Aspergillus fumigatus]|nr:hypothetical protein KXX42_004306 [Aspergillus fumigatus]KAJ8196676.1 hypothetical protein LV157_001650 [Aspergillus fumigatus]KAJ8216204.1 hypothetical protein LV164_001078 [Aspergillus fumigatus]